MSFKILATLFLLIICIAPGSKAGFFDGLPLSAPNLIFAAAILLGIFGTPWEKNTMSRRMIFSSLALIICLQFLSFYFLPVGWNVCIQSSVRAPHGNSPCEHSLEFPSGKNSFTYEDIDFSRKNFPLYFFNDSSRFNFYKPESDINRDTLPFTITASTFLISHKGDFLQVSADKNFMLKVNDTSFSYTASSDRKKKSIQKISLIPNIVNHVMFVYSANRNNRNSLFVQLPRESFFANNAETDIPNTEWATLLKVSNGILLAILILSFVFSLKTAAKKFERREILFLAFGAMLLIGFWWLIVETGMTFYDAFIPFSTLLVGTSLVFTLSNPMARKRILPFVIFILFLNSCLLTTRNTEPQEAIFFSGGGDHLGHEWAARRIALSANFEELIAPIKEAPDYYQPLHRFFLAPLHAIFGESMWGPYAIQTFFFSMAFLALLSSLQYFGTATTTTFSLAAILFLSDRRTSALEMIQSPLQQAIALPFILLALTALLTLIGKRAYLSHKRRLTFFSGGIAFGTGIMIRTDWIPILSGILAGIGFFLLQREHQEGGATRQPLRRILLKNILFFKSSIALFLVGLSIFPFLIGLKNYVFAGQFTFIPTSGFVNLLDDIKTVVKNDIAYHENSTGVFLQTIARDFSGRYGDLIVILWNNVSGKIIGIAPVRIALWSATGIAAFLSFFLILRKRKFFKPAYAAFFCLILSFVSLVGTESFFYQHNGVAMTAIYDIFVALILGLGISLIAENSNAVNRIREIFSEKVASLRASFQKNKELSIFLLSAIPKNAGILDRIKIGYRPYICPFSDLLDLLPDQASVFDIGCGNGMFLSLVSKFKHPSMLGGIEISDRLVQNAKVVLKNAEAPVSLRTFDGRSIPKEVSSYRYVFLIDVLHHVPKKNQLSFLRRTHEKMASGSTLIVKDIDAGNAVLSKFNKLHDLLFAGEIGHEIHSVRLRKELSRIGFDVSPILKKRMFVYPHYTIICKKTFNHPLPGK